MPYWNFLLCSCLFTLFPLHLNAVAVTSTATASVVFSIHRISKVSVSGNPAHFYISSVPAGNEPASCMDYSTCYNVTTNDSSQIIVGSLDADMPPGLVFTCELHPPEGAISAGIITLSTTPKLLVSGIAHTQQKGMKIGYCLHATSQAQNTPVQTRVVTYTIGP